MPRVCWVSVSICCPVNTEHLYNICTMLNQRRRRWADVVQILYNVLCLLGVHVLFTAPGCSLSPGPNPHDPE